jgi:hypothetical protein
MHVLLAHTWPRAQAHAPVLWHHLSALCLREHATAGTDAGAATLDVSVEHSQTQTASATPLAAAPSLASMWAMRALQMLAACGGQACQAAVGDTECELQLVLHGGNADQAGLDARSSCQHAASDAGTVVDHTAAALVRLNPQLAPALHSLIRMMRDAWPSPDSLAV